MDNNQKIEKDLDIILIKKTYNENEIIYESYLSIESANEDLILHSNFQWAKSNIIYNEFDSSSSSSSFPTEWKDGPIPLSINNNSNSNTSSTIMEDQKKMMTDLSCLNLDKSTIQTKKTFNQFRQEMQSELTHLHINIRKEYEKYQTYAIGLKLLPKLNNKEKENQSCERFIWSVICVTTLRTVSQQGFIQPGTFLPNEDSSVIIINVLLQALVSLITHLKPRRSDLKKKSIRIIVSEELQQPLQTLLNTLNSFRNQSQHTPIYIDTINNINTNNNSKRIPLIFYWNLRIQVLWNWFPQGYHILNNIKGNHSFFCNFVNRIVDYFYIHPNQLQNHGPPAQHIFDIHDIYRDSLMRSIDNNNNNNNIINLKLKNYILNIHVFDVREGTMNDNNDVDHIQDYDKDLQQWQLLVKLQISYMKNDEIKLIIPHLDIYYTQTEFGEEKTNNQQDALLTWAIQKTITHYKFVEPPSSLNVSFDQKLSSSSFSQWFSARKKISELVDNTPLEEKIFSLRRMQMYYRLKWLPWLEKLVQEKQINYI